jgi:ABC-2 type transport system ATP-binding protein
MNVEFRHVSKWYGEVVAVSDLSLTLEPGITGLLGANGAGKTTTLMLLGGLLRPSLGEILVSGRRLRSHPSLYRSLGIVLDGERLYPRMTPRSYVCLHAKLNDVPEPDTATEEALDAVDLAPLGEQPLGGLSKGQRQRAKIAGAIVHRPSLLALDEPMAGLDPVQRARLSALVRDFADRGATVVISSHILAEVEPLASRVVVLAEGRLAASGDVRGIRALLAERRPQTVTVRTDGARRLAAALVALPSTVGVRVAGGAVEAATQSPETLAFELPRLTRALEVSLDEVWASDESLEQVFRLLVER